MMSTNFLPNCHTPPIYICQLAGDNVAVNNNNSDLSNMLRQRRVMMSLTLTDLAKRSGISSSYLGRIEAGERFPSARILRKLARPLDLEENELFALAGYLSSSPPGVDGENPAYISSSLDPHVVRALLQESVEVQQATLGILTILKSLARSKTENKGVSK